MKKRYIEFETHHQRITRTDEFFVVGGSKNYLHARFCFCDDWADEQVTAVFSAGGKSYTRLIVDGECCVPWEVLQHKNFFVGCMAGSLITSNAAEVKVNACGVQPGTPGVEPTPSAYEQMVSIMEETKKIAQSVRDDADNGEFDGPAGPKGDPGVVKFVVVNELPETDTENAIYLVPTTDSAEGNLFDEYIFVDGKWEKIGSAAVAVDMSGYIKITDVATTGTVGVVRCGEGLYMAGNGKININPADTSHINAKATQGRCITPANLDYAVKAGLADNKQEWTEEEKASARDLLGVTDQIGDIEEALDGIIAIQNALIGGSVTVTCPYCGEQTTAEPHVSKSCPNCGDPITVCHECGAVVALNGPPECGECGTPVEIGGD